MLTRPRLAFHNAVVQVSFRLDGARGITLDANARGRSHRRLRFRARR